MRQVGYSNANRAFFPQEFNGLLLIKEYDEELLFSFMNGMDWQVVRFENDVWMPIDLESGYAPTVPHRLIYSIDIYNDHWWLSSNWGLYQLSNAGELMNHFNAGNSLITDDHLNRIYFSNDQEAWLSYFQGQCLDRIYCQ